MSSNTIIPVLTQVGRLGDCLFLIAASYAHALSVDAEYRIAWSAKHETRTLKEFLGSTNVFEEAAEEPPINYEYKGLGYKKIPEDFTNGGINGWFQSAKYFEKYDYEIRYALRQFCALKKKPGTLGIHIRLTDKETEFNHEWPVYNCDILANAISKTKNRKIILCSDEPTKARKMLEDALCILEEKNYSIEVHEGTIYEDMQVLISAEEFIGSASGVSWWVAYLGRHKHVVMDAIYKNTVTAEERKDMLVDGWDLSHPKDVLQCRKKKIACIYIATGHYAQWFDLNYKTIEFYLFPECEKHYFLFSDAIFCEKYHNVTYIRKEWEEWPSPALSKFELPLTIAGMLKDYDYTFFINADFYMTAPLHSSLLPDIVSGEWLIAVFEQYNGRDSDTLGFERRYISNAYIPYGTKNIPYVQGAFYLAATFEYLHMCSVSAMWYKADSMNGIMPVWHDESYLNKYLLTRKVKRLPPGAFDAVIWANKPAAMFNHNKDYRFIRNKPDDVLFIRSADN